jgi:recombination protein RecA
MANKFKIFKGRELPNRQVYPTGIIALDYVTGGGLYESSMYMFAGTTHSGKTTAALQTAKSFIEQGLRVVYIDAEGSVKNDDLDRIGISSLIETQPDSFVTIYPDSCEDIPSILNEFKSVTKDHEDYTLFIIDSVAALYPLSFNDKLSGTDSSASEMGIRARFWSSNQQHISNIVRDHNLIVIFINQLRVNLGGYGPSDVMPAGSALQYMCSALLKFKSNLKPVDKKEESTLLTTITCTKSRFGTVNSQVEVHISASGFESDHTLIELARKEGLIQLRGPWYYLTEELATTAGVDVKLGLGEVKTIELLNQNKSLYKLIYDKIIEVNNSKRTVVLDLDEE